MSEPLEALRSQIASDLSHMADPLRQRLRDIDEWIETHRRALADLSEMRREVVNALKPLVDVETIPQAPGAVGPKLGSKNKRSKHTPTTNIRVNPTSRGGITGMGISEERLDELLNWLRTTMNGSSFHASGIVREYPHVAKRFGGQSTISRAFLVLSDREQIALDSVGRRGEKFFKVVS